MPPSCETLNPGYALTACPGFSYALSLYPKKTHPFAGVSIGYKSLSMLTRIYLGAMALMFTAFGLLSLFRPEVMTSSLGVDIAGPNGTFEMRGIFGGVSLGAAALCTSGSMRTAMIRPALWFIVAYMGGYCFARLASVGLGDLPEPATWRFVAFEAVSLLIAARALRQEAG